MRWPLWSDDNAMMAALKITRPVRTPDTEGGWTTVLAPQRTMYGAIIDSPFRTSMICRASEDIKPEDIVDDDGSIYRVLELLTPLGAPQQKWQLSAAEMPPFPLVTTTA